MSFLINKCSILRCYLLLWVFLQIESAWKLPGEKMLSGFWRGVESRGWWLDLYFKVILSCRPAGCTCMCDVSWGCVLIQNTGVCPWVAAEGQENQVTWDSRGWVKSGNPAKHPLPRHIDALKSSSSLQYTQIHTPTHVHVLDLAPFLLANDTMVTEHSISMCFMAFSCLKKQNYCRCYSGETAMAGWIEMGGGRWSGRSMGRLTRRWGELKEKKRLWGEQRKSVWHLCSGPTENATSAWHISFIHADLCSLSLIWVSPSELSSLPAVTHLWSPPFA